MSAVHAAHPAVIEHPAARAIPRPSRLPRVRTLLAASLVFCGLAVAWAWIAGETAMAFWASVSVVPLVTPVAFAYVLDLSIMHGVWAPTVLDALAVVLLLAGLGRAMSLLDEL